MCDVALALTKTLPRARVSVLLVLFLRLIENGDLRYGKPRRPYRSADRSRVDRARGFIHLRRPDRDRDWNVNRKRPPILPLVLELQSPFVCLAVCLANGHKLFGEWRAYGGLDATLCRSGAGKQFCSVPPSPCVGVRRFEERRTERRPRPIFGLAMHAAPPPPPSPAAGPVGLISLPRHQPAAPSARPACLRPLRFLFLSPSLHFRFSTSSERAAKSTEAEAVWVVT